MFTQPVAQEEQAKAAGKAAREHAPQEAAPGSEQLEPEILRPRGQRVLCVANRTVESDRPIQQETVRFATAGAMDCSE